MTASSAPHFIKFVEALAAGKIVTKRDGDGQWKLHSEYAFDGNWEDYRIEEPEPVVEVEKTVGQVAYEAYANSDPSITHNWELSPHKPCWEAAASAVIVWHASRKQPASPWPAGVTIHNPDNLTPEQFGDPAIWRPATPDETADCEHERWLGSWGDACRIDVLFRSCQRTYRIRRSVRDWPSAKVEVKEPRIEVEIDLPDGETRTLKRRWREDKDGKIYICVSICDPEPPPGLIDIPPGSKLMHPNGDWFIPHESTGVYFQSFSFVRTASELESEGWLIQRPGSDEFVPFKRGV